LLDAFIINIVKINIKPFVKMKMRNYSFDYLNSSAYLLATWIERNNIFPPKLNDPKSIILKNKQPIYLRKKSPNAFFVCRMNVQNEVSRKGYKFNMQIVSKTASILWRNASTDEKKQYSLLASEIREIYFSSKLNSTKNSYNPYNSFPLSSKSNIFKEENSYAYEEENSYAYKEENPCVNKEENSRIFNEDIFLQSIEYHDNNYNLIFPSSEIFLNELDINSNVLF
ncbi:MAG TPA: hypothetical protein VJ697_03805, partial [Nitrososphaeraceae archaeon]|nr:hypothetical protein [Nitrososphaeraceae archaeon]